MVQHCKSMISSGEGGVVYFVRKRANKAARQIIRFLYALNSFLDIYFPVVFVGDNLVRLFG